MKTAPLAFIAVAAICVGCSQPAGSPNALAPSGTSTASSTAAKSAKTSDIAVTTTVMDLDGSSGPSDITSDGHGSYMNGSASVISILTANGYNGITWGDWQFDTLSSATRSVGHSFDADDEIVPGTATPNPPYLGTQTFPSRIEVKCTFQHKDMLTMAAGSSMTCPMVGRFTMPNGDNYGFGPALSFTGYPETTDIQILCNAANSGGCSDWSLEPIGSTGSEAIGRVVLSSTSHGKTTDTNKGDFLIRFLIHVTRP